MRAVNYIIVGQGLAGSCLALELLKRKKKVLVVDMPQANSASKIAAGIFNPITGRTNQPTWKASEVIYTLFEFYSSIEKLLSINLLNRIPIYRPFVTKDEIGKWPEESNEWIQKICTESQYSNSVNDPFGGMLINNAGYLKINDFLPAIRSYFFSHCEFLQEPFDFENIQLTDKIFYKNYVAERIIFCEGCGAKSNPWFDWLPIRKLKGELLTIKGHLPADVIINRGIFSLPLGHDKFLMGSTYVHDESEGVTTTGMEEIMLRAGKLFKNEFIVVDHTWGHRPTTIDRRPILGCHPSHQNICIFNGLGTKGVSLAPFFALHLADWLEGLSVLNKEINIERFYSLSFKSDF